MTKNKIVYVLAVLFGMCSVAVAKENRVQDIVLTTTDRKCSVHYLSHLDTTGWYIGDTEGVSCAFGAVSGQGRVSILNAFGKEVEQISGYFNQGFWVGNQPVMIPLKSLYLTDSDTHILAAELGKEEQVHYIARMSAYRRTDGTYGPFLGCEPVQVIAVMPDSSLVEDEQIQQKIITSVIQKSEAVCANVSQIYLYASQLENPENKDIFFFADINLESGEIKIRRLPSSKRTHDVLRYPEEKTPAIPMPTEVRRERAVPIMEVKPIIPEKQGKEAPLKIEVKPVQRRIQPMPIVIQDEALEPAPIEQKVVQKEESFSLKNQVDVMIDYQALDLIPNLLTISRLLKQPVSGQALIHISRFDNRGTAIVNEPVSLRVKGSGLSLGWGIAKGDFSYVMPEGTLPEIRGFIQIQSFMPVSMEEK